MYSIVCPDWDNPAELFLVSTFAFLCVLAVTANRLSLPLVNTRGGLVTYSKFAHGVQFGISMPSKWAMALFYVPSVCFSVGYYLFHKQSITCVLCVVHFGKRTLECLFLHRPSGSVPIATMIFATALYVLAAFSECRFTQEYPIATTTTTTGLFHFAVGLSGNLYHHYLLAILRKSGEKAYKVPVGGLFSLVTCPHYLFELIGWLGMAIISRTFVNFLVFLGMFLYLTDRAYYQTEWYLNHNHLKDKYPKDRRHIIPFIY